VPNSFDFTPTNAVWKGWPAALPSRLVVELAGVRPLFTVNDFKELAISPDCGLKNVSILNTADQSPASGSTPCRPTRDWPMLLGVAPNTD
jgi:hypothetical protein